MARKTKPRAYLTLERNGWWMGEYTYTWVARDTWNNYITSARIKKDCEKNCRYYGYVPESY